MKVCSKLAGANIRGKLDKEYTEQREINHFCVLFIKYTLKNKRRIILK